MGFETFLTKIRNHFYTKFRAADSTTLLFFENKNKSTPGNKPIPSPDPENPAATSFIRVIVDPNVSEELSPGEGLNVGFVELIVMTPTKIGPGGAEALADTAADQFRRENSNNTADSGRIVFGRPRLSKPFQPDEARWQVTVRIPYRHQESIAA